MSQSFVKCSYCGKSFLKENRQINENLKLGHNIYCSPRCQYLAKDKKIELVCENPACCKKFRRALKALSPHNYCSSSCAAIINNKLIPKRKAILNRCMYCGSEIKHHSKYCSPECRSNALRPDKEEVIFRIQDFYKENNRIPFKREIWSIYKPARLYFGTWNNAIEAAGFDPNPILFARRHIAEDGHICDSLAEKLIDDYLFKENIPHERNIPYPEGTYTADFKIGDKLVEYFGLSGEHKRYDELKDIKKMIAQKYKLNLIEIYPKDLYPNNNLSMILPI